MSSADPYRESVVSSYPAERAVEINATEQQLRADTGPYTTGAVFAPSEVAEHELGYDVEIPVGGAEIELQYKAVRTEIDSRAFESGRQYDAHRFKFNSAQAETLLGRATRRGVMFYALPTITDSNNLASALEQTVFVDVIGIAQISVDIGMPGVVGTHESGWLHDRSQFYVARGHPDEPAAVYLKEETSAYADPELYEKIPSRYVHTWEELVGGTLAGVFGTPVVRSGEPAFGYERRCRYLHTMAEIVSGRRKGAEAADAVRSYLAEVQGRSGTVDPITDGVRVNEHDRFAEIETPDGRQTYRLPPDEVKQEVDPGQAFCNALLDSLDWVKWEEEEQRYESDYSDGYESEIGGTDHPLALRGGYRRVVGL